MNIIKFTDTFIENDIVYNDHFRGKYCYAPRMTWAVPFKEITENSYADLEKFGNIGDVTLYINISDYVEYIDEVSTEKANSIAKYISFNDFVPDDHITLEELKLFRQWLASTLLAMDVDVQEYDEKTVQMLNYYAKDMYDEVIKQLNNFSQPVSSLIFDSFSSCGCTATPNIYSTIKGTSTCDPIAFYRQNIYNFMIEKFSNIDFWKDLDKEFLAEFKLYIDGIIDYNLPLYISDYVSEFADCSCVNVANTAQDLMQTILKNLSMSLQYMIDDKIDGHKNFIADAFRSWSSKLYEKMQW